MTVRQIRELRRRQILDATGWDIRNPAESAAALFIRSCAKPWLGLPEYQCTVDQYRLDFAWRKLKVAIEIDGPMHFAPHLAASDRLKDHHLRSLGWVVFRIDADEDNADQIAEQLVSVMRMINGLC